MSRFDHDRVMSVLDQAMQLPGARRMAFLDSTCVGEPELRREVEELLGLAEPASRAFDRAAGAVFRADPEQIGPYRIIEPVGEGGMAVVYKAQQDSPVKRIVALKLIKLGMDTRQFVSRFEAERQALAMMEHPGIAKIFDAGATETGRPYFVMEFVSGRPLIEYCDERRLDVRKRLELFKLVCLAVEHAHRKGIIHRDIKSSNVLITEIDGAAVPKVIDFGVAKAIQEPLARHTLQTERDQLIGTLEYMSPEQAERGAGDIDTRADVYSLGVLLYELLAGARPIASEALRTAGYDEARRILLEANPPRPSARLDALGAADAQRIALCRSESLPTLLRDLRSELEWIPLKAMRRDREQRYRSASELADDIDNYIHRRPLIAGPESKWYRAKKFLRRHKAGVVATAAMILLLIGGIVATTWEAIRATRAEARATEQRDNANATLNFVIEDMMAGATPEKITDAKVRDQIIKAMITPAAERVGTAFHDRPIIEASIREAIASVLMQIGRADLALPHEEAALSIRRRLLGDDHLDTLSSLNLYAFVLEGLSRAADAEPYYKQVLEKRRRILGEDNPKTLLSTNNFAHVLGSLGRYAESEPLYHQAFELRRRVLGSDDPDTLQSLNDWAATLLKIDRVAEAEPLLKECLERRRTVLGEDHPLTITSIHNYAYVLRSLNRRADAEPLFKETYERRQRVLGADHPDAMWSQCEYGELLLSNRRADEAERLLKDAMERSRRVLGPDHTLSVKILNSYAGFLLNTKRAAEAEPLFKDALEHRRRALGEHHPETLTAMNNYAVALRNLGRLDEAEPLLQQALATATTHPSLGPQHRQTRAFATSYAKLLDQLGRSTDAAAVRKQFGLPASATKP